METDQTEPAQSQNDATVWLPALADYIPHSDRRSGPYKRADRVFKRLVQDMEHHTADRMIKAARVSWLTIQMEDVEAEMATGGSADLGQYSSACNTIRGMLTEIGPFKSASQRASERALAEAAVAAVRAHAEGSEASKASSRNNYEALKRRFPHLR